MSVIIPKLRQQVEVWLRIEPPLPVWECLADLEPENYQIVATEIPAREAGDTVAELTWLVRKLTRRYVLPDGTARRTGDSDLIVVPGSKTVLRLLVYPEFPGQMFGLNVLPFGNHCYAILLGAYLKNGPFHPCYCQVVNQRRSTLRVSGNRRADEFGHPA